MQPFRDDQDRGCGIPHSGIATLPISPSPGVRSPRLVREDHFMHVRILYLTGEGHIPFVAGRIPNLHVLRDL